MTAQTSYKHPLFILRRICAALVASTLLSPYGLYAAQKVVTAPGTVKANARVVKLPAGKGVSYLAGRPDSDIAEFSNGKRMRIGQLRRLEALGRKIRSTPRRSMPSVLRAKPAASGQRIANKEELQAALKLPDNTTVQLPSGRRATVGQIRFFMPKVEERVGHPLSQQRQQPKLTGAALRVTKQTSREKWKEIMQKPDDTILESPGGKRITVGMLRQAVQSYRQRNAAPSR